MQIPFLTPQSGVNWFLHRVRVREGSEIGLEGRFCSGLPTLIDGVKCRGHSQYIALFSDFQKVAIGFFF